MLLDINFLNKPINTSVLIAGQEFMDHQRGDLYKLLVEFLNKEMVFDNAGNAGLADHWRFRDFDRLHDGLEAIILQETGITIDLQEDYVPNAGVDSGWFSPGNVLNIPGLEGFMTAKQTNIGQAFKALKVDILKGWVDTSKGKVGGDFSKIKFRLYLNPWVESFMRVKFLARYKVSIQEALAGIITHEVGHVFTGFMYTYRNVIDPIISTTAIKLIVDGKVYGKERVDIVKDAFKVLEIGQQVDEELISDFSGPEFVVYFNKAIGTRDTRRTLSVGVQERSSEIYADMYAVRMGCPKSMVAALTALPSNAYTGIQSVAWTAITILAVMAAEIPLVAISGPAALLFVVLYLAGTTVGTDYDTPYRRIKAILRDHIVQLNADTSIAKRDRVKFLQDAKDMEKMVKDNKPFLEGTAVQRVVGYILNGNDFRKQDFEHYTDEILAHTLSLYKNAF